MAEELNVSPETIRRDLDRLEKAGKLKKVYGGAILATSDSGEPPFDQKQMINEKEKRAIGRLAALLVEDNDILMLGNGTTVIEIIRYLNDKNNVTIITHSAPVMQLAMEIFKGRIIFIGGEVDVRQKSTIGPLSELMLRNMKASKAFISAGGVSTVDGITDYDLNQAHMSRILKERAEQVIVLADHTKFGKTTFAHICHLEDISILISDWHCSDEWEKMLAHTEIQLLCAEEEKV
ncbi:DeoR/GlpR family DNA-binding transcription regulator [Aneurinibacillus sp. Ricciae_BoGa-3]|uniref:DeoR/GlpR family DNA-binding transcription regulator n=1 Tax=Aneurinibacillus sp. Ricciae_BoGa-3 TaxID=3022697 RepID=UPI00234257ED|nr:DeoR/GlpR family DNA-binding transcription regulator [Aneurinibacillus sp. Ricciae_BoGa-3]WCK52594.1 DeoR/GlpR family DNA-binding transcription regulator [Aneurinibacillus sp. Ricciae_BoGa-3]